MFPAGTHGRPNRPEVGYLGVIFSLKADLVLRVPFQLCLIFFKIKTAVGRPILNRIYALLHDSRRSRPGNHSC